MGPSNVKDSRKQKHERKVALAHMARVAAGAKQHKFASNGLLTKISQIVFRVWVIWWCSVSIQAHTRRLFSFQGRSFLAFVLSPVEPLQDWLAELDGWVAKAPEFFTQKPLILDLSRVLLTNADYLELLVALRARQLRLISVEGVDPDWIEPGLASLGGGKGVHDAGPDIHQKAGVNPEETPGEPEVNSLMLKLPVRSGQSVFFPRGDITVSGSVSSGAEIVAGGSIHVYGALRGRAFAGAAGNSEARIFCQRFEAELVVIGGVYKSSEHFDPDFFGKPVQAWREGETLKLKVME